jgi:hypothetical protein
MSSERNGLLRREDEAVRAPVVEHLVLLRELVARPDEVDATVVARPGVDLRRHHEPLDAVRTAALAKEVVAVAQDREGGRDPPDPLIDLSKQATAQQFGADVGSSRSGKDGLSPKTDLSVKGW